MNIRDLQVVLAEYTDAWINSQPPAERTALRLERDELDAELASMMARQQQQVRVQV